MRHHSVHPRLLINLRRVNFTRLWELFFLQVKRADYARDEENPEGKAAKRNRQTH
jgi:hypothetical protein